MRFYSRKMEPLANDSFEARIVKALEAQGEVRVPANFAARVAGSLPAVRPVRRESHAGRTLAAVFAVVLLVAMVWLAPASAVQMSVRNFAFDAEMGACAVLAGMAMVMARVWDRV